LEHANKASQWSQDAHRQSEKLAGKAKGKSAGKS
jgi:hypothetical protein